MVQPRWPTANSERTSDSARNSSGDATWLGRALPSSVRSSRFLSAEKPNAPACIASRRRRFISFSSASVTDVRSRAAFIPST